MLLLFRIHVGCLGVHIDMPLTLSFSKWLHLQKGGADLRVVKI